MSERWKKGLLAAGWNVRKAVELAVAIEEMGAEMYRSLARRWEANESLRTLFTRLADEEGAHRDGFQALLSSVGMRRRDAASELDEECLRAIALGCLESGAFDDIDELVEREQVLDRVSKFENYTLLYYRGLKDVLGTNPVLDTMIAEEKRHAVDVMRAFGGT